MVWSSPLDKAATIGLATTNEISLFKAIGVLGAAALVLVSGSSASAQTLHPLAVTTTRPSGMMSTMSATAHGHGPNMNCASAANFVVWLLPSTKTYYRKGQASFGKGPGRYVCRREAIAKQARLGGNAVMDSGSSMRPVKTMAPRAMSSAMPMPMSSPMPMTSKRPMASPAPTPSPRA